MLAAAHSETIAAIATPSGRGGIGVVRISGGDLSAWAQPLCGRTLVARRAIRARFVDRDGRVIDDGLALYFPAPHSYTGEDVLELHGHGGPVVTRMLLARALELGARLAEPGEFTRRAFLNDKLDLAQAESVADVIDASTEAAVRSAMRSLRGEFSSVVRALVEQLIELRMFVEATLDFPEEEIDSLDRADIRERMQRLRGAVQSALERGRQGSLLRTGMNVVLAGQPNVGKSSLLNRLAGEEVAIVTPIAGTTRDTVRQSIQVQGIPLNIIDTAGLRDSTDEVERLGIERTWAEIERADALVLIVDARQGVTAADATILARMPERLPQLIVFNKIDLLDAQARQMAAAQSPAPILLSALHGEGIDALQRALLDIAGWHPGSEDVFMARERHLDALRRAAADLERARGTMDRPELFAEELRRAQQALSEITGEFSADDLLGEIFARFCIGK